MAEILNLRGNEKRDNLKSYLLMNNIKTEIHYPVAPHQQKALLGDNLGYFPIAEQIHNTTLSLPISYCHTEDEINHVIETLNKF